MVEVGHPVEHDLVVPRAQCAEQDVVRMETGMPPSPLLDRRRPARVRAQGTLGVVPGLQLRIDQIPRELVHDEQRRQSSQMVDSLGERHEMVDDTAGNDRVELPVHLAEVRLPEVRPVGRSRVDADRVVARVEERRDDSAAVAAPDFEDARRSLRQVM